MGFWKSERGINGDSWADEMGRCMKALEKMTATNSKTYGEGEHKITLNEFADLIEFCSRGHLVCEVFHLADGKLPLSKLSGKEQETFPNRGQIHCINLQEKKGVNHGRRNDYQS